jgi:hypothetical protein
MARKKKPRNQKQELDFTLNNPKDESSRRSLGSYYIKKNSSGTWSLLLESYEKGDRSQETISKALYYRFGLRPEMTVQQAREQIKKYNFLRKVENEEVRSQMLALKRADRLTGISKTLFPPELVRQFKEKIYNLHTTERYKIRMDGVFSLVQEMISKEIKIQPSKYADEVDKITNYFIKRQYSSSYSSDILYMLNWWGKFYAKQTGTYFEKIERIRENVRKAINRSHSFKVTGIRTPALPIDEEVLSRMKIKIDTTNEKEVYWLNWVESSYRFGLRPDELDRIIGNVEVDFDKNGIEIVKVEQTKTVFDGEDRNSIKFIPVLCQEQADCLQKIIAGKMKRPKPKWIHETAKDPNKKYKRHEKYDCYSGRKGATDYWLEKLEQSLENCSLFLGNRSIETTWKHYKNKSKPFFSDTDYTKKKRLKSAG